MLGEPLTTEGIAAAGTGEPEQGLRSLTPMGEAWNALDFYPEPPASDGGWGYTINRVPYACTFEQLRSYIAWGRSKRIKLVWTPGSRRMVPPEEVPELLDDIKHRDVLYTKQQLRTYLITALIWTALAVVNASTAGARTNTPFISYLILPLVLGIIPAAQLAWALRRARIRPFTLRDALDAGQQIRYQDWLGRHRAPFTVSFIIAMLVVGLVQIYTSFQHLFDGIWRGGSGRTWSAIDAAGLVKSAVWDGEVWRLFTGSVLHGSIWHFLFNVLALYAFGKVVEVLVGRAYLVIVFFCSALVGSILSLLLVPATSVGSSGGIMGVVGFLAVLGYYNRSNLPPGFLKSILSTVTFVAVFGLIAFVLIDNAAHAGGALCGAALGYLLLPHRPTSLPLKSRPAISMLGWLCTAGLVASLLGSIIAMFTWH